VRIQSRHFGVIEIEEEKFIRFPEGIIGFPEAKSFSLLNIPSVEPYQWLHCVNDPNLCFLVVPVLNLRPDYQLKLSEAEKQILQLLPEDRPVALGIVVMPESAMDATVDLLAPVVVNERTRTATQVINECADYKTRHAITEELNQAREGEHHAGADPQEEAVFDAR